MTGIDSSGVSGVLIIDLAIIIQLHNYVIYTWIALELNSLQHVRLTRHNFRSIWRCMRLFLLSIIIVLQSTILVINTFSNR